MGQGAHKASWERHAEGPRAHPCRGYSTVREKSEEALPLLMRTGLPLDEVKAADTEQGELCVCVLWERGEKRHSRINACSCRDELLGRATQDSQHAGRWGQKTACLENGLHPGTLQPFQPCAWSRYYMVFRP